MAEIFRPSPEMQDIYDKDKEENKETDELIRQGKLKEAAEKKLGTRMFDAIESGAVGSVQWLQKQAEENPDTYTDDVLRLLGGGLKNTAWAISKIPLLDKLAEGEDWLAGQARALNEQLTPWLDPRFAGWGTRIGTGILADKGLRKAISGVQRGVRVSQALSKADEIMAARKNPALANVLMKQINDPNWRQTIPKGKLPYPDKIRRDILLERTKIPTIEELENAVVGSLNENKRNWKYIRGTVTNQSRAKWNEIGNRLQQQFGGTDAQKGAFIEIQRAAVKQVENQNRILNKRFKFNYLEFANTAIEEGIAKGVTDITSVDDLVYKLYLEMVSNPRSADLFDLGHIRSAKNIARETSEGIATTADYASNLRSEIKRSIRDFNKDGKLIEAGNIARGSRQDAPKIVDMLLGTSPNVEVEYLRFLDPSLDNILTNIIPFEKHDHFMNFLRKGIRKWQGSKKNPLIGKQQLDQYPDKLRELIDKYIKKLDRGDFLDDPAKSDFIDEALVRRKSGIESIEQAEAEGRAVFRKTMPRFRGDERG